MAQERLLVRASAPAKVILFGEHSVVYGAPALAAAIDGRTTVEIHTHDNPEIIFDFQSLASHLKVPLPLIAAEQHRETDKTKKCALIVVANYSKIFNSLKGLKVTVFSDLPVGAGLGSSASFSIALSAAFAILESRLDGGDCSEESEIVPSDSLLASIKSTAYECEKIFHGSPSGIDTAVCTMGGIIKFRREVGVEKIAEKFPMKIIVVDTKIPRETSVLVGRVRSLKENQPEIVEDVLSAMRKVAEVAEQNIRSPTTDSSQKLIELAGINHGLLYTLGVSHPILEQINSLLIGCGVGFKLTGAGGGGNALVFVPPEVSEVAILEKLKLAGFGKTVVVNAGGPGLRIQTFRIDPSIQS